MTQAQAEYETAQEVAATFRCSSRKVTDLARQRGIGINLGGRAGWRFNDADIQALREAMRPATKVTPRRRRRTQ